MHHGRDRDREEREVATAAHRALGHAVTSAELMFNTPAERAREARSRLAFTGCVDSQ